MSDLYDTDAAAWSEQQADALRRRAANEIDWDNVAEEIESLSRSDKREIRSRLAVICEHLLKWRFQPDARSGSWRSPIREGRDKVADVIEESPSLADYPATHLVGPRGAARRRQMRPGWPICRRPVPGRSSKCWITGSGHERPDRQTEVRQSGVEG